MLRNVKEIFKGITVSLPARAIALQETDELTPGVG
jgi:hypothetical protein